MCKIVQDKNEDTPADPESPSEENVTTEKEMGSKVSLRSKGCDQASIRGSRVSLKSNKNEDQSKSQDMGSRVSVKVNEEEGQEEENMGSSSTLKGTEPAPSDQNMGSKVSVKNTEEGTTLDSGSMASLKSDAKKDSLGSRASLRSKGDGISGEEVKKSTASLRNKEDKPEGMGSKVSLHSRRESKGEIEESKASLKSKDGDVIKQENVGSRTSLKSHGEMGSKVSLKSKAESNMGSKVSIKSKSDSNAAIEAAGTEDEENLRVRPTARARKDSKSMRQISKH